MDCECVSIIRTRGWPALPLRRALLTWIEASQRAVARLSLLQDLAARLARHDLFAALRCWRRHEDKGAWVDDAASKTARRVVAGELRNDMAATFASLVAAAWWRRMCRHAVRTIVWRGAAMAMRTWMDQASASHSVLACVSTSPLLFCHWPPHPPPPSSPRIRRRSW